MMDRMTGIKFLIAFLMILPCLIQPSTADEAKCVVKEVNNTNCINMNSNETDPCFDCICLWRRNPEGMKCVANLENCGDCSDGYVDVKIQKDCVHSVCAKPTVPDVTTPAQVAATLAPVPIAKKPIAVDSPVDLPGDSPEVKPPDVVETTTISNLDYGSATTIILGNPPDKYDGSEDEQSEDVKTDQSGSSACSGDVSCTSDSSSSESNSSPDTGIKEIQTVNQEEGVKDTHEQMNVEKEKKVEEVTTGSSPLTIVVIVLVVTVMALAGGWWYVKNKKVTDGAIEAERMKRMSGMESGTEMKIMPSSKTNAAIEMDPKSEIDPLLNGAQDLNNRLQTFRPEDEVRT